MAIRNRTFISSRRRSPTAWELSFISTGVTTVVANGKTLLSSSAGLLISNFTIVRTRGILCIGSDQTGATEDQVGAFGVGIVSEQARAAGAASIPGPVSEAIWDGWFVHQFMINRFVNVTGVGVDANFVKTIEIDSKAMRKVDSNDDLVLMVENGSGSTGFVFTAQMRFLIKRSVSA